MRKILGKHHARSEGVTFFCMLYLFSASFVLNSGKENMHRGLSVTIKFDLCREEKGGMVESVKVLFPYISDILVD